MSDIKVAPFLGTETSLPDLRDLMLRNGGRVTENLVSYFEPRAMISPWARRKPMIKANDTDILEFEPSTQANIEEIDEMRDLGYGISVPSVLSEPPSRLYTLVEQEYNGFGYHYHRPRGGVESPYRISDFCGYWPNAIAPMKIILPSRIAYVGLYGEEGTEIDALRFTEFSLAALDYNSSLAIKDGLDIARWYHVPAGPPIYPAVPDTVSGWRSGVYMLAQGGDSLTGYYTIEAVAFGRFSLLNDSAVDPNQTEFLAHFGGATVKMLPIMADMPYETIPDDYLKVGINENDWLGVTTYALPDGITEVEVDGEIGAVQEMYSRVRIIDVFGQYYDSNKESVFVKFVVDGQPDYINLYGPPTSITIALVSDYDASGDISNAPQQTFYGVDLSSIQVLTAQFDRDRTFTDYHIELWWDGKRQRSVKIREAI